MKDAAFLSQHAFPSAEQNTMARNHEFWITNVSKLIDIYTNYNGTQYADQLLKIKKTGCQALWKPHGEITYIVWLASNHKNMHFLVDVHDDEFGLISADIWQNF